MEISKNDLRKIFKEKRLALTPEERREFSSRICCNAAKTDIFKESLCVAFYAADNSEADLWELFEHFSGEKKFFLPRYKAEEKIYEMVQIHNRSNDLVTGKYGLAEPRAELPPASQNEYECMLYLVPGVAFDSQCRRLGRGKGFYDRLLADAKFSMGIFYECQRFEGDIPAEPHDINLDIIVTEKQLYHTPAERKQCRIKTNEIEKGKQK